MHYAVIFILLLSFVLGLGLLAKKLSIPYPILFVLGGVLIGFVPHLPVLRVDPEFIFFVFLPPLLYYQAVSTSWRDFRRELRPITLMAVGLVLATTVAVAYVAHAIIPDFPLSAGFVLGAIISPPDAIAASAIAQRLGLPRRVITILEGESLVNDSTSLVIFKVALLAVAMKGAVHLDAIWLPGEFLYVSIVGIAVGLAIGWATSLLRQRIIHHGPQIVLTVSLLTPFVSYIIADDLLHVSGVLSVVATGLYFGWVSPVISTSTVRLQTHAVWETIVYLLNGFVFVLIGLQLPGILRGMEGSLWPEPLIYAVVINLVCIVVRIAWIFPGAYLPHWFSARIRAREVLPDWRQVFIVSWCGMRGVVSLAAALVLNGYPMFPQVHLVQFIAVSVIFTTLVFQGLTLPFLIRYFGVGDDGIAAREELAARKVMVVDVLKQVAEVRKAKGYPESAIEQVEHFYVEQAQSLNDDLAEQLGWSEKRHHTLSVRKLQRSMIKSQRAVLVDLRRSGEIGDDVMHKIEHELDLEEARLKV